MPTPAERQKRYRRHVKGDHSLCDPHRECAAATRPGVAADAEFDRPRETRGEKLVRELRTGLGPELLVLLEEAGRITDRLDRLDAILTGSRKEWMRFRTNEDGVVTVYLNTALAEARQQATALRGLMVEIGKVKAVKPAASGGEPRGLSGVTDELAPRRKTSPA